MLPALRLWCDECWRPAGLRSECARLAALDGRQPAFGLRFSNLTYRGVITHGPYRFTRHPAYLSKNLFWWSASLPFLVTDGGPVEAIRNVVGLSLVSAIYYWRARTEEAHLLGEDAKYREYHAWMARQGTITAPLGALTRALGRGRSESLQPAE